METGCVGCAEVAVGVVDTVTSCEEVLSDVVLAGGTERVGGNVVWGGGSGERGGRGGGRKRREREGGRDIEGEGGRGREREGEGSK